MAINEMDPWLADVYGTGGADDLEKTAQMHILSKLAEEEGVDLSGLDDEQLGELYAQVADGDEGQEEVYVEPEPQSEEFLAKEAQAKFEEADFLGRVMAHSFTQEMDKIAGRMDGVKAFASRAGNKAKSIGSSAKSKVVGAGKRTGQLLAGGRKGEHGEMAGRRAGNSVKGFKQMRGEALKSTGARVGAVGAAGGAGYAATREKRASAFEKLAEQHAASMLQAHGINPANGMQTPHVAPPVELAQEGDQFGQALDERAFEILAENGYDVDSLIGDAGGQDGGQGGMQGGFQGGMQA